MARWTKASARCCLSLAHHLEHDQQVQQDKTQGRRGWDLRCRFHRKRMVVTLLFDRAKARMGCLAMLALLRFRGAAYPVMRATF